MMEKNAKIYVAGHFGMVGSAIVRKLKEAGYNNFVYSSRQNCDFIRQEQVETFFEKEKPEYVFVAAAKVGGIVANNTYRAQFVYENLMIQNNLIHSAWKFGAKKLLFLGSSCIYPKFSPQPMPENALLTSELEFTNEPYAIAKIAALKMCESYNLQYGTNFISVMPTNLYGPNDNFDLEKSHVLPALMRKMHLGKLLQKQDWNAIQQDLEQHPIEGINSIQNQDIVLEKFSKYGISTHQDQVQVKLWGTGSPMREFLHADDLAAACVYVMNNVDFIDILNKDFGISNPQFPLSKPQVFNTHINIGMGNEITIKNLALLLQEIIGFEGELHWDSSKPDGTPRKLLDISKMKNYGWEASTDFKQSLKILYENYAESKPQNK